MPKAELASGLGRLRQASGQERPMPRSLPTAKEGEPSRRGPRDGLVQIAAHFDPAVRKQLAALAADQERNQRDLLGEALNDLFVKYKKSAVYDVYGEGSKSRPRGR